jgi:adenylate kinase
MNLILMGAPGAGKGTQSAVISEKWNIPALSTGDLLRGAMKAGTELGNKVKSYMDSGNLVPDEVVIGIIKDRLDEDDCKNGFILDGFPRTIPQAEALDEMGVRIDTVLELHVPDEEIVVRMSGRRVCPKCGATYHTKYNPSTAGDKCDKCGDVLSIRKDDDPEVVKSRLVVYHNETEPLKEYYGKKGIVKTVVGQENLADTTKLTLEALGI